MRDLKFAIKKEANFNSKAGNSKYPPYDIKGDELNNLIIHGKVLFAWNGRRI